MSTQPSNTYPKPFAPCIVGWPFTLPLWRLVFLFLSEILIKSPRKMFICIIYRSKLDRWPCHVTLTEKRPKNTLSRVFSTYILGQKVDLMRNVTSSRRHVLGQKVDLIRNVTLSRLRFWANGLIYSGKKCFVYWRTEALKKARGCMACAIHVHSVQVIDIVLSTIYFSLLCWQDLIVYHHAPWRCLV